MARDVTFISFLQLRRIEASHRKKTNKKVLSAPKFEDIFLRLQNKPEPEK